MADTPKQFDQFLIPDIKPESNIVSFAGGSILQSGVFKSPNYTKGQSGWQVDAAGNADFQSVSIRGYVVAAQGSFGGDGSDGDLRIDSGTTTVDLANARVKILNYNNLTIIGTGKLAFSNPHTNGSFIIIKVLNDATLTSTGTPIIDASGMGATGGAARTGNGNGNDGTDGYAQFLRTKKGTGATGGGANVGVGGAVGVMEYRYLNFIMQKYNAMFPGAGAGSGSVSTASGTTISGAGGNGGGALVIEVAGDLNFPASAGTISAAGATGGNASRTIVDAANQAGGGGGGGGGFVLVLYNSATSAAGTVTAAAGAGGTGITSAGDNAGGGGGGGSMEAAGSNGLGTAAGGTGGAGAAGTAVLAQNTLA